MNITKRSICYVPTYVTGEAVWTRIWTKHYIMGMYAARIIFGEKVKSTKCLIRVH